VAAPRGVVDAFRGGVLGGTPAVGTGDADLTLLATGGTGEADLTGAVGVVPFAGGATSSGAGISTLREAAKVGDGARTLLLAGETIVGEGARTVVDTGGTTGDGALADGAADAVVDVDTDVDWGDNTGEGDLILLPLDGGLSLKMLVSGLFAEEGAEEATGGLPIEDVAAPDATDIIG